MWNISSCFVTNGEQGMSIHLVMKARTAWIAMWVAAATGWAHGQELTEYLDTAFGWRASHLTMGETPGSLTKGLPPGKQISTRYAGVPTPKPLLRQVRNRDEDSAKAPCRGWRFFPETPQKLMPYLDGVFIPGNTCAEPCVWENRDDLSTAAQRIKTTLSEVGLQYQLVMSYNYAAIAPKQQGYRRDFSSFNTQLSGKWFLAKDCDNSQGIFLSFEADWGAGCNFSQRKGGVKNSLGTLSQPQGCLRGGNGVFLPELALGYSGFDGKWIGMIGTLDVSNYLDQNAYAASWNGNLMNSAFVSNPCLPLEWGNWGYMSAWQPCDNFYAMYATTGCNAEVNHNPFRYISDNYWVHIGELGFIFDDVWGLGPGTYRAQYTVTRHDGEDGGGAALNIQQQLGKHSRVGFFSRCAYLDQDAAAVTGVKAAATAGLVLQAPFRSKGWGSRSNHDQVAFGFLWQRAAATERPYEHKNEYGLELTAVVQLTPTFFLQPDVQYIFDPIHARDGDGAWVMQVQGVFRF